MDMFPIQTERGAAPHPMRIPWELAELAYSVYAATYGRDQSLKRLAERGGFGPSEMDEYLPNWRERCDLTMGLADANGKLIAEVQRLEKWINDTQSGMWINCVYCGHRYGPNTEAPSMRDVLQSHVEKCSKHPMSKLKIIVDAINVLRENEGDSVTIPCDNPDFDGPACYVESVAEWTGWEPRRFVGETLTSALQAALKAKGNSNAQEGEDPQGPPQNTENLT